MGLQLPEIATAASFFGVKGLVHNSHNLMFWPRGSVRRCITARSARSLSTRFQHQCILLFVLRYSSSSPTYHLSLTLTNFHRVPLGRPISISAPSGRADSVRRENQYGVWIAHPSPRSINLKCSHPFWARASAIKFHQRLCPRYRRTARLQNPLNPSLLSVRRHLYCAGIMWSEWRSEMSTSVTRFPGRQVKTRFWVLSTITMISSVARCGLSL
jgi:hypothetical protein